MDIFKKFSFINVKLMGDILTGLYCRQRPEQKKNRGGNARPCLGCMILEVVYFSFLKFFHSGAFL